MVNYTMWGVEGMSGIDTGACRTREDWPSMGWGGRWEAGKKAGKKALTKGWEISHCFTL